MDGQVDRFRPPTRRTIRRLFGYPQDCFRRNNSDEVKDKYIDEMRDEMRDRIFGICLPGWVGK